MPGEGGGHVTINFCLFGGETLPLIQGGRFELVQHTRKATGPTPTPVAFGDGDSPWNPSSPPPCGTTAPDSGGGAGRVRYHFGQVVRLRVGGTAGRIRGDQGFGCGDPGPSCTAEQRQGGVLGQPRCHRARPGRGVTGHHGGSGGCRRVPGVGVGAGEPGGCGGAGAAEGIPEHHRRHCPAGHREAQGHQLGRHLRQLRGPRNPVEECQGEP